MVERPRGEKKQTKRKAFFVYILECSDGTLYTGIADNVERRIREHNGEGTRGAKYTSARRPVSLVYSERCRNRSVALKREYAIKSLTRKQKSDLIDSA